MIADRLKALQKQAQDAAARLAPPCDTAVTLHAIAAECALLAGLATPPAGPLDRLGDALDRARVQTESLLDAVALDDAHHRAPLAGEASDLARASDLIDLVAGIVAKTAADLSDAAALREAHALALALRAWAAAHGGIAVGNISPADCAALALTPRAHSGVQRGG
jgi:hypothetical protein